MTEKDKITAYEPRHNELMVTILQAATIISESLNNKKKLKEYIPLIRDELQKLIKIYINLHGDAKATQSHLGNVLKLTTENFQGARKILRRMFSIILSKTKYDENQAEYELSEELEEISKDFINWIDVRTESELDKIIKKALEFGIPPKLIFEIFLGSIDDAQKQKILIAAFIQVGNYYSFPKNIYDSVIFLKKDNKQLELPFRS
jgi:hypothetical protein